MSFQRFLVRILLKHDVGVLIVSRLMQCIKIVAGSFS